MLYRAIHNRLSVCGPACVGRLCFLATGVVALCDHVTGQELSLTIFYLGPILAAAWYVSRVASYVLALVSVLAALLTYYTSAHVYTHWFIPIWNGAGLLAVFIVAGRLLGAVRARLEAERRLARVDPLTGVLNGRAFLEEGARLLAAAARERQPLTVAYIDLDNFKTVNDTRGHLEGDRLLRTVAGVIGGALRTYDLMARLGGDEFAVLLPRTARPAAAQTLDRLRAELAREAGREGWPIAVSIGAATFAAPPASLEAAIRAADELMYRAKQAGKGRVEYEER